MEEYLQHMRTLRSQMNDVEDHAAKISAEEQTHITTIQAMEKDLASVKSEAMKLKEDADLMMKIKGEICSQILDKQKRIVSLESNSSNLLQTSELIQRERISLSAKLIEKGAYYTKVADGINSNLQQQQEWINSHWVNGEMGKDALAKKNFDQKTVETEGMCATDDNLVTYSMGSDARKSAMTKLNSARSKVDEIAAMKSKITAENTKMKESIVQLKNRMKEFKPELVAMDVKNLEEEYQALLSDKAGELEYLNSLQQQIKKLKGISHVIRCECGVGYKVEMDLCASYENGQDPLNLLEG